MDQRTHPSTHFDGWLLYLSNTKKLLPNTVRLYSRTIEQLAKDHPGKDISELTRLELEMWLETKGGSSSTYSNRLSALRSFYRFLVRREVRLDDATLNIDAPRRHKGVPKPVKDLEETKRRCDLEDIKANEKSPSLNRRVGETRDIITFLAETGLRISEGCSVDLQGPAPEEITIIGKGNKECIVLLTPKAREAIDRLGGKIGIGPRAVQRRLERVDIHPHMLRHWRATSLVRKGVEIGTVSKIMRHSSPAITMVYAEYAQDIMRDALERADT